MTETVQSILAATLLQPERNWYLSRLARHLGCRPSRLQRPLVALVHSGILVREREGNRAYYRANQECPFLFELQNLIAKAAGAAVVLRNLLLPFADQIAVAFVYGSLAKGKEQPRSDVDLMIIGEVGLSDIAGALDAAEEKLGRPVNPLVFSRNEIRAKASPEQPFLRQVLKEEKLFVLGNQDVLAALLERRTDRETHANARRDRKSTRSSRKKLA